MKDENREPASLEVREKISDDVVSMASDLGYSMHPSMDPDIN